MSACLSVVGRLGKWQWMMRAAKPCSLQSSFTLCLSLSVSLSLAPRSLYLSNHVLTVPVKKFGHLLIPGFFFIFAIFYI